MGRARLYLQLEFRPKGKTYCPWINKDIAAVLRRMGATEKVKNLKGDKVRRPVYDDRHCG